MSIDAVWLPEQADTVAAAEAAWARAFLGALESHRAGVYVNFLDSDDDPSRVREAYGDANYRRLAEVKATYDPENVFHNNKNIEPGTPAQWATATRTEASVRGTAPPSRSAGW
jgi:FAD/FMN-containing dehydrogenase